MLIVLIRTLFYNANFCCSLCLHNDAYYTKLVFYFLSKQANYYEHYANIDEYFLNICIKYDLWYLNLNYSTAYLKRAIIFGMFLFKVKSNKLAF